MGGSAITPRNGGLRLRLDFGIVHLVRRLDLADELFPGRLDDEIRDILLVTTTVAVEDPEDTAARAKPLVHALRVFEDDGEAALGVRVELRALVERLLEARKEHATDVLFVIDRRTERAGRLIGREREAARAQRDESLSDLHLEIRLRLPVVCLHLCVDELRERTLVILEDVRHLFVILQVGTDVRNGLRGQLAEDAPLAATR